MNNYLNFEHTYGKELRKRVRQLENEYRKLGRYCCHLHFNLQCKKNGVTPKHAKIPGTWRKEEDKRVIRRAERAILNNKIGEIVKKKQQLFKSIEGQQKEISSKVPRDLYEGLLKTNEERKRKEQERARIKQRDKYYVLKYGVKYGEYTRYVDESERPNERKRRSKCHSPGGPKQV